MKQSEFESLMMAHDNLQRELADIKRLMSKDKHELIKSNIALNKRVQELENRIADDEHFVAEILEQNKRYRVAIRECIEGMNEGGAGTRSFVYERLIEVLEGE